MHVDYWYVSFGESSTQDLEISYPPVLATSPKERISHVFLWVFFVEEETKAERGWVAPYLISDGSKVSLTLKFTPHTLPKRSSAQMLVPNENGSQRSTGCGGGVSTKNWSPHGDLQAGGGRGFHGSLQ